LRASERKALVPSGRDCSTKGRLTAFSQGFPLREARRFEQAMTATADWASSVLAPMWGVRITFSRISSASRGLSGRGGSPS
jgi:hypothetical protein